MIGEEEDDEETILSLSLCLRNELCYLLLLCFINNKIVDRLFSLFWFGSWRRCLFMGSRRGWTVRSRRRRGSIFSDAAKRLR